MALYLTLPETYYLQRIMLAMPCNKFLTYIILYLGYLGMPSLKVGLLFKFRNVSYLLGHPVYSRGARDSKIGKVA